MKHLKTIFREFQEVAATLPEQTWHISARILLQILLTSKDEESFEQEVQKRFKNDERLDLYLENVEPQVVASHMKGLQQIAA